ncbi:MAG: hypothetical protein COX70_02105 [Flavobacteriales bacterium CG_4_10_14_0_2_um_filter_32_8]|nr:MAG: hypothetical protein COX70_02105 [Flavobacteriales bacterium CG_4_10_14_0_2_um_filter_32_8]PJB14491.1 MAG: hypothetical protein CO118_08250 [Flavobacteriales bacterium CG_4_9_14_3_um_filter_32_8]
MNTKLTLKLEQSVIEQAKEYAVSHKRSLSKIVETYLKSLVNKNETDELQISPFVKSMSTGVNIPADLDYKTEYVNRLNEKYK